MQPKVTIVLPVYNVEPYLRQCLDSIVNQTMREIQIICVNDGSTDGSLGILDGYAARDPRIMIINQENQGGGSARNAAFPHIQGKYTYFVDPDDWIDSQLCEKLFKFAEVNQDEITYLKSFYRVDQSGSGISYARAGMENYSQNADLSLPDRKKFFFSIHAPWRKFFNSDFLLANQITFASGKRPSNDSLQNWMGLVHARKTAVWDEALYYHRIRQGSYQTNKDFSSKLVIFRVYDEIHEFLIQSGYYHQYKEFYLAQKLRGVFGLYARSPGKIRREMFEMALENFGEEERVFCQNASPIYRGVVFSGKVFAKKEKKLMRYLFFSILVCLYVYSYLFILTLKTKDNIVN